VFENLVRNAVESIPESTEGVVRVTIQRRSHGDTAIVTVRDTGNGIDAELLPRVFLPFQTGKASGTGLGLPLARKIVILHGGTITISSTSNAGTEVRVELPGRPA
jgi:two-component system, sporulation sensor kinase D